jgi:hypothetical protein
MIAEALSTKRLLATINSGKPQITGIRTLISSAGAANDSLDPSVVYVGKASRYLHLAHEDDGAILVNGNDTIICYDIDVMQIINELLQLFEFYNSWEASLLHVDAGPEAIQDIIDLSERLLPGPCAIIDMYGTMLGMSKNYPADGYGRAWKQTFESAGVPLAIINLPVFNAHGMQLTSWGDVPHILHYENGERFIGAEIFIDDIAAIGLVVHEADAFEQQFSLGDIQTVTILCQIIALLYQRGNLDSTVSVKAMVTGLLKGKDVDISIFERLTSTMHVEQPWQVLRFRKTQILAGSLSQVRNSVLVRTIHASPVKSITAIYEDDVISIISASELEAFLKLLECNVTLEDYATAVSYPVYSPLDFPMALSQMTFALAQSDGKSGIYPIEDIAFAFMLHKLREKNQALAIHHPVLDLLADYDRQNSSKLYPTLYHYLLADRNLLKTAAAMQVHRNTMRNRMARIEELVPELSLENPSVRMHVLISYMMREPSWVR